VEEATIAFEANRVPTCASEGPERTPSIQHVKRQFNKNNNFRSQASEVVI
jgi:hypothetical protein